MPESDESLIQPTSLKLLLGRLELAVKGSGFGVWEYELQTNELQWDAKMHSIYGYQLDTFDKSPLAWRACIHPDDLPLTDHKFDLMMQGQTLEIFEFRIIHHQTKEIRYIEGNGALELDPFGRPYRLVGMNRDITDRKLIEKTLEAERIARITTSKMAALGEMASGIAHEINNPLTVVNISNLKIRTLLEKNSGLNTELTEHLDRINDTVKRIAKIVRSLQNFSRNSQLDQLEPTSLQVAIHDTIEICKNRLEKLKIDLKVKMPQETIEVLSKPTELSQVLLNLLNNSVDATEKLSVKWIEIEVLASEETVEIRVVDSGCGIPADIQSKMMQPFYTSKPFGQGTGLGLSISKGIIKSHGGKLFYDNSMSNTCFVIRLNRLKSIYFNISESTRPVDFAGGN